MVQEVPVQKLSRADSLALRISALLPDSVFPPARAAVKVVSLDDSTVLFESNARTLFVPASNMKLFTTATALSILGPLYRFETRVGFDPLTRRIYLKGGGDPMLTDDELDSLAAALKAQRIGRGPWTLVGDVSRFDSVYWGKGWMWDDETDPTGMPVSALSVDGNFVEVTVHGGGTIGQAPSVSVSPRTSFVTIDNKARVVDSVRTPLRVDRPLQPPSNTLQITGEVLPWSTRRIKVAIWQPEFFTLTLFREALEHVGIRCGRILLDTVPRGVAVSGRISRRLDSVVTFTNKVSDNLSAECLAKTLGAEGFGIPGSWDGGMGVVRDYLQCIGIDTTRLSVEDGSGVSRYDLVSANDIIRLLTAMYHRKDIFPVFFGSLPVADEDGTLSHRMRSGPAANVLRAKTGTAAGISSLSGYTTSADGVPLAFAILMEGLPGTAWRFRILQDNIGHVLSGWRVKGL